MAELGLKSGTVVTKNESEQIDADGWIIEVVPIWRFLLDLPESM
jgi:predicted AAA+ superfamily ATPase